MTDKVYSSTRDEKNLDVALEILAGAIPESQTDAMSAYSKSLRFLRRIKDPRVGPLIGDIEDVYAYPERRTHNAAVANLHDFREQLHEEKLNRETSKKEALSGLGASERKFSGLHLVGLIAILVFLWRVLPAAK